MQAYINTAVKAALSAGKLIVRYLDKLDTLEVREKQHNDFVSDVDIAAEKIIVETILKNYPNHGVIAEESDTINPEAEIQWVIDPLDGTTNYLHGLPHFAVSIGIKIKNRTEYGVIYDPIRQEIFTASRGRGAQMNSRRIRVSARKNIQTALLGTGFPFKNKEIADKFFASFQHIFHQCAGIRRAGSAALDLAYVAAGRLDGYWEYSLQPWDMAAGALIIKEAGGLVTDFSGGEQYLENGNIVAANPKLIRQLLQQLQTKAYSTSQKL